MVISLLDVITILSSFSNGQVLKAFIAVTRLVFDLFFVV